MMTCWFVKTWIALSALGLLQCADRSRDARSPSPSTMTPAAGAREGSFQSGSTWSQPEPMMEPSSTEPGTSVQSDTTGVTLEDSQIVGVIIGIHREELEQARIAQKKATSVRVREFADTIIHDHSDARDRAERVSRALGFTAAESPVQRQLQANASSSLAKITAARAADFDSIYIGEQVTMHQQALDIIDRQLMPTARSSDLQSLVIELRPLIEHHLNEAKELQKSIGGGGTGSPPKGK